MSDYQGEIPDGIRTQLATRKLAKRLGQLKIGEEYANPLPLSDVLRFANINKQKPNRCTAHAVCTAFELQEMDANIWAQDDLQWKWQGEVSSITAALKSAVENGIPFTDGENEYVEYAESFAKLRHSAPEHRFWIQQRIYPMIHIPHHEGLWEDAEKSGYLRKFSDPSGELGHRIVCGGFDEDYFILLDSKGENHGRWGNGTVRLPFENFKYLSADKPSFIMFL